MGQLRRGVVEAEVHPLILVELMTITVLEVIVRFVDCCGIDDKGLIRIRKSKKDRQHKKKIDNNDLQSTTQKTKPSNITNPTENRR
jgi:hypothetical protein